MEALSVRDYRNNLAASFDRADKGERVLIRRKNQIYALMSVGREDLTITPELQGRQCRSMGSRFRRKQGFRRRCRRGYRAIYPRQGRRSAR